MGRPFSAVTRPSVTALTMRNPLVSVLTSCFNAAEFLPHAIESVLAQTYEDFEFILIDDGSTDATLDIIRSYAAKDDRIVVIQKGNTDLTDSLNVGIQRAKGEWIARLDADDIAFPNRLFDQLNFVKKNPDVALVGGGCIEIDKTGKFIKQHTYPGDHAKLLKNLETVSFFFPHSSAFINKKHIMTLGCYNNRFKRSQDWDLWLRIAETARIACLPKPLVKLRKHASMISNTDNGKLQQISGLAGIICHFRRKYHMSDPSQMNELIWQQFLKWVEFKLEEENYFSVTNRWQYIRNSWYSDTNTNIISRTALILKEIAQEKSLRKAVLSRFRENNLALKLAKQIIPVIEN